MAPLPCVFWWHLVVHMPPPYPTPAWGWGGGLLWTDGWEGVRGHYCDGGGERGGVRLKNEKAGVSITASPIFPLNHCSDTHCLLQHMLMVVKTELDAQPTPHPPPPPHPDPHPDLIIPALPCPTR